MDTPDDTPISPEAAIPAPEPMPDPEPAFPVEPEPVWLKKSRLP